MAGISISMSNVAQKFAHSLATLALVFLPLAAPLAAVADSTCVPPPDPGPGIHHPVGADAGLYTYNCDTQQWDSPHFTYDPATGNYTPSPAIVYTYNTNTGAYDYTTWQYDAPQNTYVAVNQSTASPPSGATVVGGPVFATSGGGSSISNTGPNSNNSIRDNGGITDGSNISNTGPNSNNNITGSGSNNTNVNNATNASITNNLTAGSSSGNAVVLSNTSAGNASSGNSTDIANVMNLLQSTSNALGGNAVTFVANINGDVNGDLMLDPSTLGSVQPAATSPAGTNTTNVVNNSNEAITNNLNLSANTGDASVSNNTSGGNATTGAAKTIANVVNMINSAITSGKSFLGVINVNGNLNGDILMPANFIDQLVAANVPTVNVIANTGPNSNNTISDNSGSNNTSVNNNNNQRIANNVNAKATTGTAAVSDNTTGGSATSGTANTNITAFNLTGSNVIGKNDLLVFVNVVGGKWVGLIVDAPPGATAAELGSGISTNSSNANNNTNIANNTNQTITNNLNLNSATGNADVNHNTKGGNATSGNADDAVNLLNVQNSSLALSNWFGILFINVFGTWNGSFGINTAAGDNVANGTNNSGGYLPGSFAASPMFSFAPKVASGTGISSGKFYSRFTSTNSGPGSQASGSSNSSSPASVLVAAKTNSKTPHSIVNTPSHLNWGVIVGGSGILAVYLLGERFYVIKQRSSRLV